MQRILRGVCNTGIVIQVRGPRKLVLVNQADNTPSNSCRFFALHNRAGDCFERCHFG